MANKPPKPDFLSRAKAAALSKDVPLPSMDMTVTVRALSVGEMDVISDACLNDGKDVGDDDAFDNKKLIHHVIAASAVDENGDRLIPEGRESEVKDLPNVVYAPLQTAALSVNGMSGADPEGNS